MEALPLALIIIFGLAAFSALAMCLPYGAEGMIDGLMVGHISHPDMQLNGTLFGWLFSMFRPLLGLNVLAYRWLAFLAQAAAALSLGAAATRYVSVRCGLSPSLWLTMCGALIGSSLYANDAADYNKVQVIGHLIFLATILGMMAQNGLRQRIPFLIASGIGVTIAAAGRLPSGPGLEMVGILSIFWLDNTPNRLRLSTIACMILCAIAAFSLFVSIRNGLPYLLLMLSDAGYAHHATQYLGLLLPRDLPDLITTAAKSVFALPCFVVLVCSVLVMTVNAQSRVGRLAFNGLILSLGFLSIAHLLSIIIKLQGYAVQIAWVQMIGLLSIAASYQPVTHQKENIQLFRIAIWLAVVAFTTRLGASRMIRLQSFYDIAPLILCLFGLIGGIRAEVTKSPMQLITVRWIATIILLAGATDIIVLKRAQLVDRFISHEMKNVTEIEDYRGLQMPQEQIDYNLQIRQIGSKLAAEDKKIKVFGYADMMGPVSMTNLPVFGSFIFTPGLKKDINCALLRRGRIDSSGKLLFIIKDDIVDNDFKSCLDNVGIYFPDGFKKIATLDVPEPFEEDGRKITFYLQY
jgi:hypothetical protein